MRGTPAHAAQDREPSQVCRLGGRQSLQELKTSQRAPASANFASSSEINDQLKLRRLLDRQVAGLLAFENPARVDPGAMTQARPRPSATTGGGAPLLW